MARSLTVVPSGVNDADDGASAGCDGRRRGGPGGSAGRAATIEVALRNKIKRLESELAEVRQQKMELDRRYERALGEAEEWRSRHQRAVTELLEVRSRLTRYGSS